MSLTPSIGSAKRAQYCSVYPVHGRFLPDWTISLGGKICSAKSQSKHGRPQME
jgi:hypothetical protein